MGVLDPARTAAYGRIALGHVAREYPNKLDHVMGSDADVRSPRDLHPVFFGSYDWHSCVHSWWTLLTVRRLQRGSGDAARIEELADATFTGAKLAQELAYLGRPEARGFERPYGWGWLLYLHHEAERHSDRQWGARLGPLARAFAAQFRTYLPLLTYPITVGTHYNTAFALILAREWAVRRDPELQRAIDDWAIRAFGERSDYRGWEPGGDEFLSPVLTAALLMSKCMAADSFSDWLDRLVLRNSWLGTQCQPVAVSDRSDGKIAHLDGLNLSRAWCLRELARAIGPRPESGAMRQLADDHFAAADHHVSGDYMGEHWLASFAMLAELAE